MNGLVLKHDQAIVAMDEDGDGWIVARSEEIGRLDILPALSVCDNSFSSAWDIGLPVGLYLIEIKPCSSHDGQLGEYDCGIDVKSCTPLWVAAPPAEAGESAA